MGRVPNGIEKDLLNTRGSLILPSSSAILDSFPKATRECQRAEERESRFAVAEI